MMSLDDDEQDERSTETLMLSSLEAPPVQSSTAELNIKYHGFEKKLTSLGQKLLEKIKSKPDANDVVICIKEPEEFRLECYNINGEIMNSNMQVMLKMSQQKKRELAEELCEYKAIKMDWICMNMEINDY
jgi:hypothetical protein